MVVLKGHGFNCAAICQRFLAAVALKGHGFTGCGKTLFVSKGKKQIAPGSSRSDPQGAVDGFISPNFRPFDILSEFFRSL